MDQIGTELCSADYFNYHHDHQYHHHHHNRGTKTSGWYKLKWQEQFCERNGTLPRLVGNILGRIYANSESVSF